MTIEELQEKYDALLQIHQENGAKIQALMSALAPVSDTYEDHFDGTGKTYDPQADSLISNEVLFQAYCVVNGIAMEQTKQFVHIGNNANVSREQQKLSDQIAKTIFGPEE